MRKILEKVASSVPATVAVTLEYSDRQKSRGLLKLDDGSEAALLLERGTGLQHGDRLLADDGLVVLVQAALEGLSIVTASDPLDLCRAAYHLGNRHVPLQISALRLAYLHDHVLDDMVRELGFHVRSRPSASSQKPARTATATRIRRGRRRARPWARAPSRSRARARASAELRRRAERTHGRERPALGSSRTRASALAGFGDVAAAPAGQSCVADRRLCLFAGPRSKRRCSAG